LVELGDEAVEAFGFAESVAEEIGLGGVDGVGLALVLGEVADEGEDLGDVGWSSGAEIEGFHRLRQISGWRGRSVGVTRA
jgi:hypothetical protein